MLLDLWPEFDEDEASLAGVTSVSDHERVLVSSASRVSVKIHVRSDGTPSR